MAIIAKASGGSWTTAGQLWQYDYGQMLIIENEDLPLAYEVHFATDSTDTITVIGTKEGVLIPDCLLLEGKWIHAWLYLHETEDEGRTVIQIDIPVIPRPQPSDEEPTPVEQSEIDQAIAALQAAVAQAQEIIEELKTYYAVFAVNEETGELNVTTKI